MDNHQNPDKKQTIRTILQQIGMTDEELYELLYGRKQQVDIIIGTPQQLLDEDIWLETEHSAEEVEEIQTRLACIAELAAAPPQPETLAGLEHLLDGAIEADETRGFLLKRMVANWRKGIGEFLRFLAFAKLQKLAVGIAELYQPDRAAYFASLTNRPQDRHVLTQFITTHLEQPRPPVQQLLAEAGARINGTGALEFALPLTAAIIAMPAEKLLKLLNLLKGEEREAETHAPVLTTEQYQKQQTKTAFLMNKLVVLDRVEDLLANQMEVQATPQQQQQQQTETALQAQQNQPAQMGTSRRPRGTRRVLKEAMEKEAREKTDMQVAALPDAAAQRPATAAKSSPPKPPSMPKDLLAGIQLNAFKDMSATSADYSQLGRKSSGLKKDKTPTPSPDPIKPQNNRER